MTATDAAAGPSEYLKVSIPHSDRPVDICHARMKPGDEAELESVALCEVDEIVVFAECDVSTISRGNASRRCLKSASSRLTKGINP